MKIKCSRDGVADVSQVFWIELVELATAGRVGTVQISLLELVRVFLEQDVRKSLALCV